MSLSSSAPAVNSESNENLPRGKGQFDLLFIGHCLELRCSQVLNSITFPFPSKIAA